jgi:hypothetical protein
VGTKATERADADVVPEEAQRVASSEQHHAGRGGAGNEPPKASAVNSTKKDSPVGLADKLKAKLFGKK